MSVIYVLLPTASLLAAAAVAAFIWAVKRGQFDDLKTPALRMLHDDDDAASPQRPPSSQQGEIGRSPRDDVGRETP